MKRNYKDELIFLQGNISKFNHLLINPPFLNPDIPTHIFTDSFFSINYYQFPHMVTPNFDTDFPKCTYKSKMVNLF